MKKILIAEDDPMVRDYYKSMVGEMGYTTLIAEDGPKARELAKSEHPDLMITDSHFSGTSSLKLIQELREHCPNLSIIIASKEKMNVGKQTLESKINIITKPVRGDLLKKEIAKMISSGSNK